jgi:hypothetical protein
MVPKPWGGIVIRPKTRLVSPSTWRAHGFAGPPLVFASRMIGTGRRQRQAENGIFIAEFFNMEYLDEYLH